MERLPWWPVSELFYAAYFSYYVMIGGVGLALFYRNRGQFFHYLSVISFIFYACYLIYIILPVVGPRIFFREIGDYRLPAGLRPALAPHFPAAVQAGPFYHLMAWIYRIFEGPGAAFPSSHVAIAIATVYFSFRYLRPIRWPHLAAVILLCAGDGLLPLSLRRRRGGRGADRRDPDPLRQPALRPVHVAVVQPIGLVHFPANGLEQPAHHGVVLENP